jgi:hypothetical protein
MYSGGSTVVPSRIVASSVQVSEQSIRTGSRRAYTGRVDGVRAVAGEKWGYRKLALSARFLAHLPIMPFLGQKIPSEDRTHLLCLPSESMKPRLILGAALMLLALTCFSFWVGNIWAASFRDLHYAEYIRRAELLFWAGAFSLVISIVLFAWGALRRHFPINR